MGKRGLGVLFAVSLAAAGACHRPSQPPVRIARRATCGRPPPHPPPGPPPSQVIQAAHGAKVERMDVAGDLLLTAGRDATKVWSTKSRALVRALPPSLDAGSVPPAFLHAAPPPLPAGNVVAAAAPDGSGIVAWSPEGMRVFRAPYAEGDAGVVAGGDPDGPAPVALAPGARTLLEARFVPTGSLKVRNAIVRRVAVGDAPFGDEIELLTFDDMCRTLAFSADGKHAAALFSDHLVVWDASTWEVAFARDLHRPDPAIAFTGDGRAIVYADQQHVLHLLDAADGRYLGSMGYVVEYLFEPDRDVAVAGERVIVGPFAAEWDAKTGAFLRGHQVALDRTHAWRVTPRGELVGVTRAAIEPRLKDACGGDALVTTSDPDAALRPITCLDAEQKVLAIARDGSRVALSRCVKRAKGDLVPCVLDRASGRRVAVPVEDDAVAFSPDASWLVAGGARWDASTGQRIAGLPELPHQRPNPTYAPHMRDGWLSDDGTLGLRTESDDAAPRTTRVRVYDLSDGTVRASLRVDGEDPYVAFAPASHDVLVGIETGAFERWADGKVVARGESAGGVFHAIRGGGDAFISLHEDGAVRVWDARTLALRATLAAFGDGEWLAFTPGGAYAGTSEVEGRVSWVFDAPLEGFGFEQFSKAFHRPDVVAARLADGTSDVAERVTRPPAVEIVRATRAEGPRGTTRLTVASRSSSRVDSVRVFAEGRPVAEAAVCAAAGEVTVDVPLLPGENRVAVTAFDDSGFSSNPAWLQVLGSTSARRPDLWVVAVGVSRYPNLDAGRQLTYPAADARAIAERLAAQAGAGGEYGAAHVAVLTDTEATRAAIERAVGGLSAMREDDVAVVFLAGHGMKPSPRDDMVFVTANARATRESLRAEGVGWPSFGAALAAAKGRVVLLLDACHSGDVSQTLVVPNEALAAALAEEGRAGVVVFAAAKGRQLSYEPGGARGLVLDAAARARILPGGDEAHGFFTAALLRSLEDPATDRDRDGAVQLSEWIDDVTLRVSAVTAHFPDGAQTPWVARREMFGDFAVARAARAARVR